MQSLEANGIVTAYEKTGRGEPIVLLHGGEEICHYFLDEAAVREVLAKIR